MECEGRNITEKKIRVIWLRNIFVVIATFIARFNHQRKLFTFLSISYIDVKSERSVVT